MPSPLFMSVVFLWTAAWAGYQPEGKSKGWWTDLCLSPHCSGVLYAQGTQHPAQIWWVTTLIWSVNGKLMAFAHFSITVEFMEAGALASKFIIDGGWRRLGRWQWHASDDSDLALRSDSIVLVWKAGRKNKSLTEHFFLPRPPAPPHTTWTKFSADYTSIFTTSFLKFCHY